MKQFLTALLAIVFMLASSHAVLATDYDVELVVPDGKESKETDAVLRVNQNDFQIIIEKQKFKNNEKSMAFSDIKVADYSYSKKPMLSAGGAVATALLVGVIFALPFLFIKKKNHWLTVQNEKDFAVIKMDSSNYRAIIADMEVHGLKIKQVKEEEKK
ncbi:MAG TPA: hypothetical protein VIL74_07515 [Pyrinomonadaceae bacterium]|jgi:hypothetical protein